MNKEGKGNLRDRAAPSKMMQAWQSTCVFSGMAGGTADRWPAAQQWWYREGGTGGAGRGREGDRADGRGS